jgi:hypothetical protein
MKKHILERYEKDENQNLIIDVSTDNIENLFNDFDKRAHFLKKDLNQDLVEYLIDSVHEIGKENFIIQFSISSPITNEISSRIRKSVNNYFIYLKELEIRKMNEMMRTSLILFLIGVTILSISLLVGAGVDDDKNVIVNVLSEGLMVAAWVSLWESLATFLIKWKPYKNKIDLYEKISTSPIVFANT